MQPESLESGERTATRPLMPANDGTQGIRTAPEAIQHAALLTTRDLNALVAVQAQPAVAPAAAERATVSVPIEGLAVEIAVRAQAGRNRFEIRLDPPELGRIEVRLDIDRNGQVSSRLMVERAETLDVLRRDAHQLERALQDAGLKTSDNGLQFTLRDQTFKERNDHQGSNARIVVADPDLPAADAVPSGYGRVLRAGGGIDIRI